MQTHINLRTKLTTKSTTKSQNSNPNSLSTKAASFHCTRFSRYERNQKYFHRTSSISKDRAASGWLHATCIQTAWAPPCHPSHTDLYSDQRRAACPTATPCSPCSSTRQGCHLPTQQEATWLNHRLVPLPVWTGASCMDSTATASSLNVFQAGGGKQSPSQEWNWQYFLDLWELYYVGLKRDNFRVAKSLNLRPAAVKEICLSGFSRCCNKHQVRI